MLPTIATGNVGSALAGEYEVANSLRFDDGSSAYLNRSLGTPSNRKIFTCSAWVKKASTGTYPIFWFGADSDNWFMVKYESDSLRIESKNSGSTIIDVRTNALYRDFSAWYHVLVVVDTTQGTASNRIKIYVNGVQETSFQTSTYPNQNTDLNVITEAEIGNQHTTQYFDGYMAEVVFVDGTAQANTDLGEFDEDSSVWKPIDVSGLTFGTNGFYLDFESSGSLGNDVSGNGNNFTVNNLTSIDQTTDTCTNNYCTMNPLLKGSNVTLKDGNLTTVGNSTSDNGNCGSTFQIPETGKWYFEYKMIPDNQGNTYPNSGIKYDATTSQVDMNGGYSGDIFVYGTYSGELIHVNNGTNITAGAPASSGDIFSWYIDQDNGAVYIAENGTMINSGDPTSGSSKTGAIYTYTAGTYPNMIILANEFGNSETQWNFGNPTFSISSGNSDGNGYGNFEYDPQGYYALNTKNLAEYG